MSHSLVKNWIHIVFSTKNRQPLITNSLEPKLYEIFQSEAASMNCSLSRVNGMPNHVHLLIMLNQSKSLADFVKQIKGASSYQINRTDWIPEKFSWQKGYGGFSVSESQVPKVQRYIDRQKKHHADTGFEEEVNELFKRHNLKSDPNFFE